MKVVKFKTVGAVVAHLQENREYTGIRHKGILYIPTLEEEESGDADSDEEDAPVVKAKAGVKAKPAAAAKSKAKVEEDEPEEAPAKKSGRGTPKAKKSDFTDEVTEILESMDKGEISAIKAVDKIVAETEGDKNAVKKAVKAFEDDADMSIEDAVESVLKAIAGGDADEEEKPAPKARGGKAKPKDDEAEEVDHDDLEVGDKVKVYWEQDSEWYAGKVKSIKKDGSILIEYEDDTEDYLDDEKVIRN